MVRIADLAEAEGRSLRSAVRTEAQALQERLRRGGNGVAVLLVGVALAIAGACLVGLGLHQYLSTVVGQAWASVIVGAILIAGAGGCVWTFNRLLRN